MPSLARPLLVVSSALLFALSMAVAPPAWAKKKPEPAAEPAPAPEPAPVEVAPPPPPEPPPAPASVSNSSFNTTITFADGTSKAGHVKGVERTVDYSGDDGWTAETSKLKLSIEANDTEKAASWADVKTIVVTPGASMTDDVDCSYSSETTPWMYDCTLRTTSTATLKDGSKGAVSNRHHWRFTFDDGSTLEFQVFKYQVREQDSRTVEFGDESSENLALYTKLQDQIRRDVKTKIVKSITVN